MKAMCRFCCAVCHGVDCGNVVSSNPNLENKTKRCGFRMIMYGKEIFWSECGLHWCGRHELQITAKHCILAEIDGHGEAAWPNTSHKTVQFKHWMSPFLCTHDPQPHRCNISTAAPALDYKGPTWEHFLFHLAAVVPPLKAMAARKISDPKPPSFEEEFGFSVVWSVSCACGRFQDMENMAYAFSARRKEVNELMQPGIIPKLWGKPSAKARAWWSHELATRHVRKHNQTTVLISVHLNFTVLQHVFPYGPKDR